MNSVDQIQYYRESGIDYEEFRQILISSSLAERRPVSDPDRLTKMADNANLIITARIGSKLVGVARSISDFTYCTYLSDLAVDQAYQHQGIGRELINKTKQEAPDALLILLSAPKAVDFYPKIGMSPHAHCYIL